MRQKLEVLLILCSSQSRSSFKGTLKTFATYIKQTPRRKSLDPKQIVTILHLLVPGETKCDACRRTKAALSVWQDMRDNASTPSTVVPLPEKRKQTTDDPLPAVEETQDTKKQKAEITSA